MINLYFRTNYLKVKKLIFFHKWRFFDCHKPCYICRFNMLWFLCLCWHLWSLLLYIFRYLTSLQEVYLLDIFYKLQLTNIKGVSQRKLMTLFPKIILFFFHTRWISNGGGKTCSFCDKKFSRGALKWIKVWNNSI